MILQYLIEELEMQQTSRYAFTQPEQFSPVKIKQIGVGVIGDDAVSRDTSEIDFTSGDTQYTMRLLTTIRYEPVLTDTGEIQYDVENEFIIPYFVNEDGERIELTNDIMKSDIGKEVINGLKDTPAFVSINREFDVAANDPTKSKEQFATTGKGKPITIINTTYFLLKNVFIDGFKKHIQTLSRENFNSAYTVFYNHIKYELENVTFVAKPDYEGDVRRANLYRKWWQAMGSQVGNVVGIDEEPTDDGISFEVSFTDTPLN